MRINPTDFVPALAPEPSDSPRQVLPRPVQPPSEAVHRPEPAHTDATSVVVEMQRDNTVVYKFIDTTNGKVIQQILSQDMVNFSQAIDQALPALRKTEGQK